MEWYVPITILPGIGFFILSTSNVLIALNDEIRTLNDQKVKYSEIIKRKLNQLKLLNLALIGQYLSALIMVLSGVISAIYAHDHIVTLTLMTGLFYYLCPSVY